MNLRFLFALLIVIAATTTSAQRRERRPAPPDELSPVSISTAQFPQRDGRIRLDLSYRIRSSFFVFVRDTAGGAGAPFGGDGELSIEILDKNKASVGRTIRHPVLRTTDPSPERMRDRFIEGGISRTLTAGDYFLSVELTDRQSRRRFFDAARPITLARQKDSSTTLSDLIVCAPASSGQDSLLRPMNWDATIPLGGNVVLAAQLRTPLRQDVVTPSIVVTRRLPDRPAGETILADSSPAAARVVPGALLPAFTESTVVYTVAPSADPGLYILRIPMRTDSLDEGEYTVRCTAAGETTERMLSVRWLSKPVTLRNFQRAVEAMRYLLPKEEFERLAKAKEQDQKTLFRQYWKQRDPTPGTAFNELLSEYYTRADHAMQEFAGVRDPDGLSTDRGRIYLLYGPPSSSRHDLSPGQPPREIWIYASIHKRFVFADPQKRGNYSLVEEGPDDEQQQ